jgi:putative tricarboxylic transport membrane protein
MHPSARRIPGELAFVLVLLVFALTALWQAYRISGLASWSSPGAVPMLAALAMAVAALRIVFVTARKPADERQQGVAPTAAFVRELLPRTIVGFTLLIVVYMFAMEPLGFVVSSFLFLVAGMRLLGERRLVYSALVSALSLAIIYVVFRTAFSVVLPQGVLRGVLP